MAIGIRYAAIMVELNINNLTRTYRKWQKI